MRFMARKNTSNIFLKAISIAIFQGNSKICFFSSDIVLGIWAIRSKKSTYWGVQDDLLNANWTLYKTFPFAFHFNRSVYFPLSHNTMEGLPLIQELLSWIWLFNEIRNTPVYLPISEASVYMTRGSPQFVLVTFYFYTEYGLWIFATDIC